MAGSYDWGITYVCPFLVVFPAHLLLFTAGDRAGEVCNLNTAAMLMVFLFLYTMTNQKEVQEKSFPRGSYESFPQDRQCFLWLATQAEVEEG